MRQTIRKQRETSLSFYKTIILFFDYLNRSRVNSLRKFIRSITPGSSDFRKLKDDSENYLDQTSIRLDILEPIYLNFCTKYGLKPKRIDEEHKLLKRYNLKLKYVQSNKTKAYVKIRWKTNFEKAKGGEPSKPLEVSGNQDKEENNQIVKFIESEIVFSEFDSDFILLTELQKTYDAYCKENHIDDLNKGNIIG